MDARSKLRPELRSMQASDWPGVQQIYREGIATGNATFETRAPSWEEWDQEHLCSCRIVAGLPGEVLGWAALAPVSGRCVYGGVAEVSVYVSFASRGRGLGRLLLQELVRLSEVEGLWTLQAGIFPENTPSLKIHQALGFRTVGVRERLGKLGDQWRDVVLLERRSETVGV